MKAVLVLLLTFVLLSSPDEAHAQRVSGLDLGSSRTAFTSVDQAELGLPQLTIVQNDATLQDVLHAHSASTVVAGPGYALFSTTSCGSPGNCLLAIDIGSTAIFAPFASAGGLGSTRVATLHTIDRFEVSTQQLRSLHADIRSQLRTEGSIIITDRDAGYTLYSSSQTTSPDCSQSTVDCIITTASGNGFVLYGVTSGR